MIASRFLLLAKLETIYGVDPTPSPTTDALIASNPSVEIIGKALERNIVYPSYGNKKQIAVGEGVKVSFDVELRGSGSPTTAPMIGRLLRACNFTEVISSNVTYTPNSSQSGESVTLYVYKDGILHKVHGCVGNVKTNLKLNEIAMLSFEFTGLYGGYQKFSDTTFPSFSYSSVSPIIFRGANAEFGSMAYAITDINVDIGNQISARKNINATTGIDRYFISQRGVKGNIKFEVISLATENLFQKWENQTEVDILFRVGSSSGNRCNITMAKCALDIPKYAEEDNLLYYDLSFRANPGNGNDEIQFVFD